MSEYLSRLIENVIIEKLKVKGCVAIEGPKYCGKTSTAKQFAKTFIELHKQLNLERYRTYVEMDDPNLFVGEKPIVFDEWQEIPELWDHIRLYIDENSKRGQFIITGSSNPEKNKIKHSGVGRIIKLTMRTLSLWESKDSTGEVSLSKLFDHQKEIHGKNEHNLDKLAFLACRGGWPEAIFESDKAALSFAIDYVDSIVKDHSMSIKQNRWSHTRAKQILKAYARNVSTSAKTTTIQKDVEANDTSIDIRTVESYIDAFKNIFIIEENQAWSPKVRSKATIRTANTRQFVDPSIATAILRLSPNELVKDLKTFGLIFESMVIRDLRIYSQFLSGEIFRYRDSSGLEVDAIIHLDDGKWGAIEIKLGGNSAIEEASENLLKLKNKVNMDKMNEPTFLAVITGGQHAYKRKDGIFVVPIGCLRD